MDIKEIEQLIHFHQDGLDQYRQHISPSAQHLEAQTIKALETLKKTVEQKEAILEATMQVTKKAIHGS